MEKVILYYKFVPVKDSDMTMRWQRELCERLHLKGRIIISPHGINGTLGGDLEDLRRYKREMNKSVIFKNIMYKWSEGSRDDFPRLSVKVRDELVSFKAAREVIVNEQGVVGGGKRLKPEQLHELVQTKGNEVIFFDGRNAYEAQVGKFKDTVVPPTRTTRDFVSELESSKYDPIKDKPVVTYCTGGVRCEVLSVLMKNRGFKDVYQLDGGIVKYIEKYGDQGLWEGALYIFDKRMVQKPSKSSKDIGQCTHCQSKTSNFENCHNLACNHLVLICPDCVKRGQQFCSQKCAKEKTSAYVQG